MGAFRTSARGIPRLLTPGDCATLPTLMDVNDLEGMLRAEQDREDRLNILDELAGYYYDEEDYGRASEYYAEGEELCSPGNSKAYFAGQKGICQYQLRMDEESGKALLEASRMFAPDKPGFNPDVHSLVLFFLGSLYEYNGDHETSLKYRAEALNSLEALPREAQWMLLSGISRNYESRNEHRRALDFNTKAISLISEDDPELAQLYDSMGVNHFELGEFREALRYFSKVLTADPEFEGKDEVQRRIGLCYQRLLDHRMALDSYQKLLELKQLGRRAGESVVWIFIEIANCHYHLGENLKVLEVVQKGLEDPAASDEESARLRGYLTNACCALGRHEEAVEAGRQALEITDDFPGIELMLPNLAMSHYHLNQLDQFEVYRALCNRKYPDLSWTKHLNKLRL